MEKIDEQLNNLSAVEVPVGIHQSVMRRVNYQKIKPVLFVSLILLALNFLVIVWHINMKLIDAEFTDMIQDLFEVFSFNFSFIRTIAESFFEIISPILFLYAILSLTGIIYISKEIKRNIYQIS
jgi:hypothetical protein